MPEHLIVVNGRFTRTRRLHLSRRSSHRISGVRHLGQLVVDRWTGCVKNAREAAFKVDSCGSHSLLGVKQYRRHVRNTDFVVYERASIQSSVDTGVDDRHTTTRSAAGL